MCGIRAVFGERPTEEEYDYTNDRVKNRGPDETTVVAQDNYTLCFHRLSIVGSDGHQPFHIEGIRLMCNGEIYNHKELEDQYNIKCTTKSDCEVILWLYKKYGIMTCVSMLRGEFAFVLIDDNTRQVFFARDDLGIKPLYMGTGKYSEENPASITCLELSSELCGFITDQVDHVLPAHVYCYDMNQRSISSQQYYSLRINPYNVTGTHGIYKKLCNAVAYRVTQTDRPLGFFLSGGVDSCTILSIALNLGLVHKPKVFTFGFDEKAPDVQAARSMVKFLQSKYGDDCIDWHVVIRTTEEGIKRLPDVIQAIGTYDTTTVRASVPMFLLSEYISKNTDVKVLLSGEGSDELFGGYLYFKHAPSEFAFQAEILKRLTELYKFDVLRSDHCTAYHGLELRPPFLDQEFVSHVLNEPDLKTPKELTKPLLRKIIKENNLCPDVIYNGRKEAFSDAVGHNWLDALEKVAKKHFDEQPIDGDTVYRLNRPSGVLTQYAPLYIEYLFDKLFDKKYKRLTSHMWVPNQEWVYTRGESSARALPEY